MSTLAQRLRKAVLEEKAVRLSLENGEEFRGRPAPSQNLQFEKSGAVLKLTSLPEEGATEESWQIPVSDIEEVELIG